ncbi:acyl-CoA carboxylase subunit beta [Corynebacterium lubricantis]|uniref:acyl-CoA carboxylase subunit beta n=1 Tax=Corynebacterium lubricantis TaxID=541095 RepID=UPI00037779FF|nr:carboxyl transferase domain-containing protein [Corynebacterium lubricantis]
MTASKPDLTTTAGKLADLRARQAEAQEPRGSEAVESVHEAGKSTARERVELLLDEGTFTETDALARHRVEEFGMDRQKYSTDGVVTGFGQIGGRRVCVFSQDPTIFDGELGEVYADKILKIYDLATKTGVPLIGIYDSAGPRFQEGIVTAAAYAKILRASTEASGLVPQIAVVAGNTSTLASLTVPISDIVIMTDDASVHLTTPEVVSKVTGVEATAASIGGANVHAQTTGLASLTAATDAEAISAARDVVSYLPVNNQAVSPLGTAAENPLDTEAPTLDEFMPDDDSVPYDVLGIINKVTDGDFYELKANYADNIVTGFAHISGRAIGVLANQPTSLAGCLNGAAADKAARFIRMCDAFNLPIVEFVDSPGFAPSTEEEHGNVTARAAALAYAYAEAQVGTVTVITRKAIGPSYVLMGSKNLGADFVYAWPTAQIALADAPTAAEKLGVDADEYADNNINPYVAAESGLVDAVIEPAATRKQVVEGLRLLERKVLHPRPKKHGNIPL